MVPREDDTATVTFAGTELKLSTIDWSGEDGQKEFTILKSLAKMW